MAVLAVFVVAVFAYSGAREYLFLSTDWGAEVISSALVDLTNTDRANLSLSKLTTSSVLQQAAQLKANDMATKGYFAHNSPEGNTPWHWFDLAGYDYQYAGENLAINFTESREVETAWMNSPGHRSNILSWYFSEIGIATAQGYYNGQPTIFVVQMFGQPKKAFATVGTLPKPLPLASPAPSPNVLSENTTPVVDEDIPAQVEPESVAPPVKVVQSDTMIAVLPARTSNIPVALVDSVAEKTPAQGALERPGSVFDDRLPSGKNMIHYLYFIIAALVLIPLGLLLRHELKAHHRRHIVYGASLLFIMVFLLVVFDLAIVRTGGII